MEANAMGTSRMGSKDGELIESVGQMVGKFTGQLYSKLGGWENQLMQSPVLAFDAGSARRDVDWELWFSA